MHSLTVKINKQFRRFMPPGIYEMAPGMAQAIIKNGFAEETDEAPGSPDEVQARYDKIAEAEAAAKKKKAAEKKAAQRKKKAEEKKNMDKKTGPSQAKKVGPSKNQKTGPSKTTKKKTPAKKTK